MRSALIATLFAAVTTAVGCGPSEPPPKTPKDKKDVFAVEVKTDNKKARSIIRKAERALRKREIDDARKILEPAYQYAGEAVLEEIRALKQKIDNAESQRIAPYIIRLANKGECEKALDRAAEWSQKRAGTTVLVFVRKQISEPMVECMIATLDKDVAKGRALAAKKNLKVALGPAGMKSLDEKVTERTVKVVVDKLKEPIAARDWSTVGKKAMAMVKNGEAGQRELGGVMKLVRNGVVEDAGKLIDKALDIKGLGASRRVGKIVPEVDAMLEAGLWEAGTGDVLGASMPKALKNKRQQLAVHVLCLDLGCKVTAPKQMWTNGFADVTAPMDPKGKSKQKLDHATAVWKIAAGSKFSLITKSAPKTLGDDMTSRIAAATGWVPAFRLRSKDTSKQIPPGAAMVGTRVWGPLRKGQKEWELGTVRAVKGAMIRVYRIADGVEVDQPLSRLRFGKLDKDQQVLGPCKKPFGLGPAVIERTKRPPRGDLLVVLSCLDKGGKKIGEPQDVLMPTLRTQPRWLR